MSLLFTFYTLWEILTCNTCPPPNPSMPAGDLIPPQNWLELNPWVGWAIAGAAAVMIPIVVKMLKE